MTLTEQRIGPGSMVTLLAAFIMLLATAWGVHAAERMDADVAYEKAKAGELVLVDIRRPGEWQRSGIATIAVPLSMHEDGFYNGIAKLRAENPGKTIALICAAGGRSTAMQRQLKRRGMNDVVDVVEGMLGNGRQPGYIGRGLPTKPWPES